jgi:integrase/recombinase XerD
LPPRLTSAIDLYMRRGRPAGSSRWLFVIHRAPIGQRLTAGGIGRIVTRRAAQAGLADRIHGPHVIRHSVATALINQGASIKQIADLLGHRSIDTTSIYAKVDLRSLVGVALPWPRLSRREVRP